MIDGTAVQLLNEYGPWAIVVLFGGVIGVLFKSLMDEKRAHLSTTKEIIPVIEDLKKSHETIVSVVQANTLERQISNAVREKSR